MFDSFTTFLANGLADFSGFSLFLVGLVLVQVTIMSITLYLHRCQAHRGLDLHPILSHFFRFWLWFTTGMRTIEWVSIHRKHHATCETEEDPHSPKIYGIKKVLFGGWSLYHHAISDETNERFGHGTPNDWLERNLYSRKILGVAILFVLEFALFGLLGLVIWAIQMLWTPFWAAGVINGVGHYIGYRNYETPDTSTNITPFAFWIGGEELHNNHHAFPSSAKFSNKRWEFDLGWMYIQIFRALGLVKVKRVAPKVLIDHEKEGLDIDTIKSIILNRVHVMSNYAKQVVGPAVKTTRFSFSGESFKFSKIKTLLVKDHSMMDNKSKKNLNDLLEDHPSLKTIYHYRIDLQKIWDRAASSQEHLLEALKDWCKEAEESGIKVLQDFAISLRKYGISPGPAMA